MQDIVYAWHSKVAYGVEREDIRMFNFPWYHIHDIRVRGTSERTSQEWNSESVQRQASSGPLKVPAHRNEWRESKVLACTYECSRRCGLDQQCCATQSNGGCGPLLSTSTSRALTAFETSHERPVMPASSLPSASSSSPVLTPSPISIDSPIAADYTQPDPNRTPTAPTTTAAFSTSAVPHPLATSSRDGRAPADEDIEMEPVPNHRRRKNSLMSPVAQTAGPSSLQGRPRAQSLRKPQSDDPRISEEPGPFPDSGLENDVEHRDSYSDEDLHDDEETGLTKGDRERRQRRKRKNTRLDQRIAQEKSVSDEQKELERGIVRKLFINCVLILLWYLFSLSISLYNKWMFDKKRLNFAFPLFTTSMHMLVQFVLSGLVLFFVPSLRPNAHRSSDLGRSRHETEPNGSSMTKFFYLTRVGPCGAATGLDIGLGNMSLKFVSLTFYTMCKSSSLAFVLLFAFMFRLEKPTWRLVAIITTMTLGVILMVFGEVEFKLGGFVLVISAAFFSGFRWGLTQILLLRNPSTSNPFSSIFFLTPVMFLVLFGLAIPVEGFGPLFEGFKILVEEYGPLLAPLFLLFPGCIAFLMTASEFALLQRTSVVTLSIAGIFKEVITISAASVVFHDKLTVINFIGLLTTLAAIIAYNYIKITKMRQEAQKEAQARHAEAEASSPSSGFASDTENEDATEETAGLLRPSIDLKPTSATTTDDDAHHSLLGSTSQGGERR
ncbi:transporter [Paramyrothecium foliicola]|nr:transporter [Paramyrothecium foliicola]